MSGHPRKHVFRRERAVIFLLCALGGLRILLLNAAYPFFNNVDEIAHFDLVHKYARGHLPEGGSEQIDPETAELIVLHASPEYLLKTDLLRDGMLPPPKWTLPDFRNSARFSRELYACRTGQNYESGSFPTYYVVAGIWCAIGRLFGMEGGHLLYWIRFLNLPLFIILVWLSHVIARMLSEDSLFLRIALPGLVAFFPQDAFHSVNSDAILPLVFSIAFYLLLKIYFQEKSTLYHLLCGGAVAAAFLAKISNLAILYLLGVIVLLQGMKRWKEKQRALSWAKPALCAAGAVIPIGLWLLRNYLVLGDLSGTADKIMQLGWTAKPIERMWGHPLFTVEGSVYFFTELIRSFWRGEFTWHQERMAMGIIDNFYVISTLLFFLIFLMVWGLRKYREEGRYGFVLIQSFCMIALSVLFLAFLSLRYDFGECLYPSQERPFFVSGRLLAGLLVPFLLLYLEGLQRISAWLKAPALSWILVAIILAGITVLEWSLAAKVFQSPYNFFHLQ